jgi:hypothetical protein
VTIQSTKRTLSRAWSRLLRSYASLGAMLKVKLGRPAVSHILGCVALLGRRVNLSVVKVVITTVATLWRLQRKGGIRFLVVYLKACSSLLQQYIGGQRLHDLTPFGARVGRTHSGCPSIIPALHRARIRQNEVWVIRFWATIFGLYRVLEFPGRVKLNSITDDSKMHSLLGSAFSSFVTTHLVKVLRQRFLSKGSIVEALDTKGGKDALTFMLGLRANPFLISKSGPAVQGHNVPEGAQSTSPASLLASAYTWLRSPLYPVLTDWCKMTNNQWVLNRIEGWAKELWVGEDSVPLSPKGPSSPFRATGWLGKLGFKSEPAGKVRVFAMVDPWTQWLMDRLHRAIFELLRNIPQDGTFDQLAPINRLNEWKKVEEQHARRPISLYSFDLSSATDRIPIVLQKILLSPFLTAWGAELWATLMVGREYACPKTIKLGRETQVLSEAGFVKYATGQPMGALSSWAMLAFVHHAFVQWAALRAGVITIGEGWYAGYAILGDDVVIASKPVATKYVELMKLMDVGIGDHKSLTSTAGSAMEFAKRTFLKGKDVSMVPFAEFVVCRQSLAGLLELVRKYSLSLGSTLSVLGYGYRAKANASKRLFSMPKRLRNYVLAYYGPGGPSYGGLRSWLPMRSATSTYKTADARVSNLVTRFFETEIKLALEILDGYLPLITEAKRLGTVYRDREHYGTVSRGEVGLVSKITNPDLTWETGADFGSVALRDGRWQRPQTLEEYNASLERAYVMDRDPNKAPFVMSTSVPSTAPWIDTAPPIFQDAGVDTQQPVSLGPTRSTQLHPGIERSIPQSIVDSLNETVYREAFLDTAISYRDLRAKLEEISISSLDWDGMENLWAGLREIETLLAALPFPRSLSIRTQGGKPLMTERRIMKRWYRHSGLFRATVTQSENE